MFAPRHIFLTTDSFFESIVQFLDHTVNRDDCESFILHHRCFYPVLFTFDLYFCFSLQGYPIKYTPVHMIPGLTTDKSMVWLNSLLEFLVVFCFLVTRGDPSLSLVGLLKLVMSLGLPSFDLKRKIGWNYIDFFVIFLSISLFIAHQCITYPPIFLLLSIVVIIPYLVRLIGLCLIIWEKVLKLTNEFSRNFLPPASIEITFLFILFFTLSSFWSVMLKSMVSNGGVPSNVLRFTDRFWVIVDSKWLFWYNLLFCFM
jgi:hypothetical protein